MSNTTVKHIATVFPVNAEALKPDPTAHRRRSIIREFSLNTSTHGIPGLARSRSVHNRVFWIVSLLIFTGIMLFFVIESIVAYFSYPTQTLVSTIVEWPQAFPAVTICNYSPIRYDRLIGSYLNYTNAMNITNTNDTTTLSSAQAHHIREFLQYKFNRNESLREYFFPLSAMLIKCAYNGEDCSVANFTSFVSLMYGLCYTFNAKLKNTSDGGVRFSSDHGGSGNLQLRLYAHSHQYVPFMSPAIGMMAMVHDNAQLPVIELGGIQLVPGRQHKLSYTKQTSSFLPSPYTHCTNKVNHAMQLFFDTFQGTDYGYSQTICNTVCTQAYTYHKCGCVSPSQWAARSVVLPGTDTVILAPLCNVTDSCYPKAAAELMITPSVRTIFCADCQQECSTVDFTIKSSALAAPARYLMAGIKQFVESSSIPLPANWFTTWPSEIEANYVALEVVCESNRVTTYTQEATISAVDVISNAGGQTGLWIGVSFLSLMEIAEMLYRLIRYQCYDARRKLLNRTPK